jgi:outer membrane autotransporter protein
MDATSGGRCIRRTVSRGAQAFACLLLAIMALAWSNLAHAQSCDFVQVGDTTVIGPAGTTVSFTLRAETACPNPTDIVLAITSDTTGGASIVPPLNPSVPLDTDYVITVNLGPTPGGSGTLQATCVPTSCIPGSLVFNFGTNNEFNYTDASGGAVVANQITPFTVATNLQFNGGPGSLGTGFTNLTNLSNYGVSAPDGGGTASTTQSIPTAGNYVVRGSLQCPVLAVLEGCAAVAPVDIPVTVEPVAVQPVGSGTPTMAAGATLPLSVSFGSASIPAADGTNMIWSVTGQPAGGDGVVAGNAVLGGNSNANFSASVPGVYQVTANSGCTFCAPGLFTFNVTVNALPVVMTAVSPNPAGGVVGTPLTFTVLLEQGGVPVNGATIQWAASVPFAPGAGASATDAAGEASFSATASAAGNFTNAVVASVDLDGIPATGDEATLAFDANIAFVASLAATGGGGQVALVDAPFAAPLQVNASNSGVPAAGVTINWSVTAGAAVLSAPTSVTNGTGDATISVTAGATPGAVTIVAARQDDPGATATFNLTVDGLGTLQIVAGDGQTLAAGSTSEPLEVALVDAAGLPVAGATISWSASAGTLASATSVTDAGGIAGNTLTVDTAGAVDVSASSPLAGAAAVFKLNGALTNLTTLTPPQREVAKAIDTLCPALAGLATPTPQQADLLARCRELGEAATLDPGAAITALDQLTSDVALAQATAAMSAAQSQFQNLKTRIAALRSGTGGTSFGGLALNTPAGPISLGALSGAFAATEDGTEVGTDFSRWGFFAAGTVGRGESEAGRVDPAYDYDIEGLTAGLDYRQSDRWVIGGSLGYTRQDTDLPGERGGLETTGWSVSAYTTYYQADSWYLDSVLTWGRNDYEMLRRIQYSLPLAGGGTSTVDQTAVADASGDLLAMALTFGRDYNRGAFGIGPYGRLMYTRLDFDDIREQTLAGAPGSGLGLHIEGRALTSLASVLGTKFTWTHSTDWGVLMPHLQLEWEHEFRDDPQAMEARFLNDPTATPMLVTGDPLDTNYFRLGLGMSMVLTGGRSGFFYYERLAGRDGESQWNLALGLRMEF